MRRKYLVGLMIGSVMLGSVGLATPAKEVNAVKGWTNIDNKVVWAQEISGAEQKDPYDPYNPYDPERGLCIDGWTIPGQDKCLSDILPQGTKISKLKPGTKSVKIKWKKQTTQTDGYEIQYAPNKNFTKAKTITINNNKTNSITIKKLKPKKKYYFRIRTYKDVMIDGKSTRFYSEKWSNKSVKTKVKMDLKITM